MFYGQKYLQIAETGVNFAWSGFSAERKLKLFNQFGHYPDSEDVYDSLIQALKDEYGADVIAAALLNPCLTFTCPMFLV